MTYKPHNPQKFTPFLRIIIDQNFILLSSQMQQSPNPKPNALNFFIFFLPLGGQGNSYSACPSASYMTHELFALPSHPECTYVNRMSKLHAHITFWVMSLRLSLKAVVLPNGVEALICIPSIAPTHFCYKNRQLQLIN